jgi:hypothetical protein
MYSQSRTNDHNESTFASPFVAEMDAKTTVAPLSTTEWTHQNELETPFWYIVEPEGNETLDETFEVEIERAYYEEFEDDPDEDIEDAEFGGTDEQLSGEETATRAFGTLEVVNDGAFSDQHSLVEEQVRAGKDFRAIKVKSSDSIIASLRTNGFKLGKKHWQQWRVTIWIRCGMVHRLRKKKSSKITNPNSRVIRGDTVFIKRTFSPTCLRQYKRFVSQSSNYRDYFFPAPKQGLLDGFLDPAIKTFALRSQTVRLNRGNYFSDEYHLKGLIRNLSVDEEISKPIRNLYIVSHYHPTGNLGVPLDKNSYQSTGQTRFSLIDYEDLEIAVTDKSLRIPEKVVLPRHGSAGSKEPFHVHIRGCNLGKRPEYVDKLKEALGSHVVVTAPRYWHGFFEVVTKKKKSLGFAEYMGYDLTVARPFRAKKWKQLRRSFEKGGFQKVDAKSISKKQLQQWLLPAWKKMRKEKADLNVSPFFVSLPFLTIDLEPAFSIKVKTKIHFQARKYTLFADADTNFVSKPVPKPRSRREKKRKYIDYRDEVQRQLELQDAFKSRDPVTNPFPWWARLGYASMDDFMKGFYWELTWSSDDKMHFKAIRYLYTVVVPITEPNNGKLIMNSYPSGSGHTTHTGLQETDTRLFYSV